MVMKRVVMGSSHAQRGERSTVLRRVDRSRVEVVEVESIIAVDGCRCRCDVAVAVDEMEMRW